MRKPPIVQLTHHLTTISHVDHYSQFLLKQLGEDKTFYLIIEQSPTLSSLRVTKKRGYFILECTLLSNEDRKKEIPSITLPSYFPLLCKNNEPSSIEELFCSSQIDFTVEERVLTTLLVLIQQLYPYRKILRSYQRSKSPSIFSIFHYWIYYFVTIFWRKR
jgi:hypothetical protein